jgi:glycosyltransferase involved in cell wall biosynthesis
MVGNSFDRKEWPAVSVVIPAWNMEMTLEKTLESIFALL